MKPTMLPPFHQIFDYYKPSIICEIGTHDGKSAIQFVDYCVKLNPKLSYVGYDVFDAVKDNEQFHEKEINGKGAGKYRTAKNSQNIKSLNSS
jgi:cephalosporin hydroxylase